MYKQGDMRQKKDMGRGQVVFHALSIVCAVAVAVVSVLQLCNVIGIKWLAFMLLAAVLVCLAVNLSLFYKKDCMGLPMYVILMLLSVAGVVASAIAGIYFILQ